MHNEIPTPFILIDAQIARRNLASLADYARQHKLGVRPHSKTHKSKVLARMQLEAGAIGLTVAKVGEAQIMAEASDDLLMAYPAIHPQRCLELAKLARTKTIRVAVDSTTAADRISEGAKAEGSTVGVLVDLDVGLHRTGVQNPAEALALAQHIDKLPNVRLDGLMFYPGHLQWKTPQLDQAMTQIDSLLGEVLERWRASGLQAKVVSGGSTPTARRSHLITRLTELRPGTYIFNDMNCVHGGFVSLEDCAARIICTIVSTAVPDQIVLDAGSKTLTSDRCGPAPDSGHGLVVGYPRAKITKLSEEHAQVDVRECDGSPKVGDRVSVIPNHICPCVNLQDRIWWQEPGDEPKPLTVDARGRVF